MKTKTFGIAGMAIAAIAILLTTSPLFIADSAFADSGHGHHYGHHHHYKHHHHHHHHYKHHHHHHHDDDDD